MKTIKMIKLTSCSNSGPVYINVEQIGHIYRMPDKMDYGRIVEKEYTCVGVTTHNNGGFKVKETPEEIFKLME